MYIEYLSKVRDTHPLVEPVEAGGVVGGEEGRREPVQQAVGRDMYVTL